MGQNDIIRAFGDWKIRVSWQQEEEKWYFSVVDVVGALTERPTPKRASTYWAVLKNRLTKEGAGELLTTCKQLKLRAIDGKLRPTDVADTQTVFRIIQSVPSEKAEPFKQWMARVASHRPQVIPKEKVGQILPWVHIAISNAKRLFLDVYHDICPGYIQNYLSEFCWKFNRRTMGDEMFDRLVVAGLGYKNSFRYNI